MLSDPLFEVSIPSRERHSISYLAKEFSSLADSDSDECVSLFYLLQIWLRKLNLRRRQIHKKRYFPHPTLFTKPRAQMSRGKSKVYLKKKKLKRSYSRRRGARQGDWSCSQSQKETVWSETYQGWGALTEQGTAPIHDQV